jgi:murein DD-endopeptidase MepM/ murein hydrolase activator NlpD
MMEQSVMTDRTNSKKPSNGSRKALEFKVYWLERKLAFQRTNQKREQNAARIEGMSPSPVKELLHLNNEFQRANEQATDLKTLTEAVNSEALLINERSVQIQEVALDKIADTERSNRQSRRLQDRSRKINHESNRMASATRELNKLSSQYHKQSESLNNETGYLNKLTRAQHQATDALNQKTRKVNTAGEAIKQASEQQVAQAEQVQILGETLNKRSTKLQSQFVKDHDDFIQLNHESEAIKQQASEKFIQLDALTDNCNDAILRINHVEEKAIDVITEGEGFLARANRSEEQAQQDFEQYQLVNKASHSLLEKLEQDGDRLMRETYTATDCLLHQASHQYKSFTDHTSARLITLTHGTESTLSDLAASTEMGIYGLLNQTVKRLDHLEGDASCRLNELLTKSSTNFVEVHQGFETASDALLSSLRSEVQATLSNTVAELDTTAISFYVDFDQKLNQQLLDTEAHVLKSVTDMKATSSNFLLEFDQQLNEKLQDTEQRVSTSVAELEETSSNFLTVLDQKLNEKFAESSLLGQTLTEKTRAENQALNHHLHQQVTETIGAFSKTSADLIGRSESTLDLLSERAASLVNESQEFLQQTERLNEKTEAVVEEGESLNEISLNLQQTGQKTIEEADSLISELGTLQSKLRAEVDDMLTYSATLNQQSAELNQEGETINDHSLVVQQESIRTQELSQEINSHSLELQQEARRVNNAFLEINQNHETLSDKLINLKIELEQLVLRGDDQFRNLNDGHAAGERINKVSYELNTETRVLNQQTIAVVEEAKASLAKTEGLNKLSRQVVGEIQGTQQELEILRDQIKNAESASVKATDAAIEIVSEGKELQQELVSAANNFKQTQLDADEELNNIQRMREETSITTEESREACSTLTQCIDDSRRINDEFLRGLESATVAHKRTEQEVETLLHETSHLQQEITDILELKNGIVDFQTNVNNCQERLDEYTNILLTCKEETGENKEVINDYQNRLENYQSDTERFRRSLEQCESRARRIESHIREYEERLISAESQPDSTLQQEISDQLEHIRMVEGRIRQDVSIKQALVDETLRSIKQNMQSEMKLVADVMLEDVKAQFVQSQKASEQKHDNANLRVEDSLEEHQSLLNKHHHTLGKHQDTLEGHEVNFTRLNTQFEDVNHRIQNYQSLLESEIDNKGDSQDSDRLTLLEARLENQDAMLNDKLPKLEKREAENETLHMTDMLDRFKQSMDEAADTNKTLKSSLDDSQKVNNQLAKINIRLQKQLDEAKSDQSDYQKKLDILEDRISVGQTSPFIQEFEQLKEREGDTLQTMQQMRLTMKESTRAMRETQKALEHFRHADNTTQPKPQRARKDAATWVGSSKQAVVSSLFAITIMGMGIFGIDAVDASNKPAEKPATASIHTSKSTAMGDNLGLEKLAKSQNNLPSDHGLDPLDFESLIDDSVEKFLWPVNAGVQDPSSISYQRHHEGVNISAELGEPVLAINDGEVIYSANEIRGYGNVIVIQHKDELMSVYANNQFNYVRTGDRVERGQLIGDVGQLFNQEAAGLYFEIRYEGKAEDPFIYLGYQSEG